jgi:hypothetical protein
MARKDPGDLHVALTHHVPLLWRDPKVGTEHILLDQMRTHVTIRGVPLSAMSTFARAGEKEASLALVHEGRAYVPFTHVTPRWIDRDAGSAPHFEFLKLRVAEKQMRLPPVAPERYAQYLAANVVERPEHGAAAWAVRTVEQTVIHDGDTLLRTVEYPARAGTPQTPAYALRCNAYAILTAHASRAKALSADPGLVDAVDRLRRIYVLLLVDAAPPGTVSAGETLAMEAARRLAGSHPHGKTRLSMADIVENLGAPIPRDDAESLAGLLR